MFIRLLVAAALAVPALTACGSHPAAAAPALEVCRDSNGSRPGGSVYAFGDVPLGCDVVSPQRLHVIGMKSVADCNDAGGRWLARICWDVDY